jgi:hypothetical protein
MPSQHPNGILRQLEFLEPLKWRKKHVGHSEVSRIYMCFRPALTRLSALQAVSLLSQARLQARDVLLL